MTIQGCYIAYPIDQRDQSASAVSLYQAIEWFENQLIQRGLVGWVFDPGDAFKVSRGAMIDDTLPRINRAALANADLVVAFLPANTPSIGVPIEIDRAVALGKHVIVFSDAKAWMLSFGHVNRIIRYLDWDDVSMGQALAEIALMDAITDQRDPDPLFVVDESEGGWNLPTRAYADDAGLDLYVSQDTVIAPGAFSDVPCGLRAALPPWSWGLIVGRSSTRRTRGLLVHPGVIDAGYRGPLFAACENLGDEPVELKAGERVSQLIVMNNATRRVEVAVVDQLPASERGDNGFGSSGA